MFLQHGAAIDALMVPFADPAASDAFSCFVEMLFARHVNYSDEVLRILDDL